MKQIGIVEKIEDGMLRVRIKRATACGENCASCSGNCKATDQVVTAVNKAGAKVGDNVLLEMNSKNVLLAAFLVYILPLLVLFCVYAVVYAMTKSEGMSTLAGIFAMLFIFFFVRILDRRLKDRYVLVAVNVL